MPVVDPELAGIKACPGLDTGSGMTKLVYIIARFNISKTGSSKPDSYLPIFPVSFILASGVSPRTNVGAVVIQLSFSK